MVKQIAYLSLALSLSACGAKSLPTGDFSADKGSMAANQELNSLVNDGEEVAPLDTSEKANLLEPELNAPLVGPTDTACPTINGSFVLTIGGEISDRITIQSKQGEAGTTAYSINNGAFYSSGNEVYRSEEAGVIGLARVACERDLVRLNYRDASGARKGLLEITVMGDEQLKIVNSEGSIAMSGNYLAAH